MTTAPRTKARKIRQKVESSVKVGRWKAKNEIQINSKSFSSTRASSGPRQWQWRRNSGNKLLRLPSEATPVRPFHSVPWYYVDVTICQENRESSTAQLYPTDLQTILNNVEAMSFLHHELDRFAEYVRLTDVEVEARNFVVGSLVGLCRYTFGRSKGAVESVEAHQKIRVTTFGSFASKGACCFSSDVDLALWGILEPADLCGEEPSLNEDVSVFDNRDYLVDGKESFYVIPKEKMVVDATLCLTDLKPAAAIEAKPSTHETTPIILESGGIVDSQAINSLPEEDLNLSCPLEASSNASPISCTSDDDVDELSDNCNYEKLNSELNEEGSDSDCEKRDDFKDFASTTNGQSRYTEMGFISVADSSSVDSKWRKKVVKSLHRLAASLKASSLYERLEVRHRAKVPIIVAETKVGVSADIALGGHNGSDTSQYAGYLLRQYKSFSPVVLLLKLLLRQANLDKPFTGGLGSYKLYVLLSYHIERHLRLGGRDDAAEVLVSFFFRYSGKGYDGASTNLSPTMTLTSHGGVADLKPIFRLGEIEDLFEKSFERLAYISFNSWTPNSSPSFLAALVNVTKLSCDRQLSIKKAECMIDHWPVRMACPNVTGGVSLFADY